MKQQQHPPNLSPIHWSSIQWHARMIQPKFASTKKKQKTQNFKPPHLSLDFGTTKETPSSITLELFIERTQTQKAMCVIFVCALEFQKQSFEIMQIVWASGNKI
jgi:hypothetical protein